eukprot:338432-Rhodomonas_salina.2
MEENGARSFVSCCYECVQLCCRVDGDQRRCGLRFNAVAANRAGVVEDGVARWDARQVQRVLLLPAHSSAAYCSDQADALYPLPRLHFAMPKPKENVSLLLTTL